MSWTLQVVPKPITHQAKAGEIVRRVIRNEINMQEEKINDAKANGDNKAKYELIRFTHALNEKLEKYIEN